MTYTAETDVAAAAAVNLLRDNVRLAGTTGVGVGGPWYYPPTAVDEDGRLWGSCADHLKRVLENRMAVRHYYRSLQPDAPAPSLLSRTGHVAVVEAFAADLLAYYRPLLAAVDPPRSDLGAQTVVLLAEANVLYNIVLAMRPWPDPAAWRTLFRSAKTKTPRATENPSLNCTPMSFVIWSF